MDEETHRLLQEAVKNPDLIDQLDEEAVLNARKSINPYAGVLPVESAINTAVLSFVNFRELYLRKFTTTAMIAFLYRNAFEAEAKPEIEAAEKKYKDEPDKLAAEIELINSTYRKLIERFLDSMFKYNPDVHVRTAHNASWKDDPERKSVYEHIVSVSTSDEVHNKAETIKSKLEANPERTQKYTTDVITHTHTLSSQLLDAAKTLLSHATSVDDQCVLARIRDEVSAIHADIGKLAKPIQADEASFASKVAPPADVFHKFDRYVTNNYEYLRDCVQAFYAEKPDFDAGFIFHDSFANVSAADSFIEQHVEEFRLPTFSANRGAVVLLGAFKKNRERAAYYGKNTAVLRHMMQQSEADAKLGKDLMEKRVKTVKKHNIETAGPDDPGLKAYIGVCNQVRELGAKKVLTREEQDELANAAALKADMEVPDNAVAMDIFYTDDVSGKLKSRKMYTQAEAPLHMQQDSEYAGKYQPSLDGKAVGDAYRKKKIKARDGSIVEIKVPASEPIGEDELA